MTPSLFCEDEGLLSYYFNNKCQLVVFKQILVLLDMFELVASCGVWNYNVDLLIWVYIPVSIFSVLGVSWTNQKPYHYIIMEWENFKHKCKILQGFSRTNY